MNYPHQSVNWIYKCLSTAAFLVSINGDEDFFFPSMRDIKQGCSLFLFLDILHSCKPYTIQNVQLSGSWW